MAAEDHAIVVGIRTYPAMSPLQGPCEDAEAFRGWLVDPTGGAVPPDQVKLLRTEDFDSPNDTDHPFADEVHELFKPFVRDGHLASRAGDTVGRRLYIYMAGHGFSARGDMTAAALYAANAEMSFAPHIAGTDYAEWFRYNAVFEEIVLIMDCCRTTSPTNRITPPPLPDTVGSPRRGSVRTFYAYAVPDGQASRERQLNGVWRGIFTAAFLDALNQAVPNPAGRVRGQELSNFIHQAVGTDQPPDIDVNSNRDVVFAERRHAEALDVGLRLNPYAGGEVVVITDHTKKEVTRVAADSGTPELALTAGFYKATVEGTDRSALFEVPSGDETVV